MATSNRKCSLTACSSSWPLQTYKKQGILKVIECALQRKDDDMQTRMQTILDSQGEQSLIEMHKNCYCSYTSKEHIKRLLGKKRKEGRVDIDDAPAARMRRSQVTDFDFKSQCLFCANVCEQLNPKHSERWNRVVQCERVGMKNAPPFKDIVLQHCGDRNDSWGSEVAIRCHGVHDLAAAEAQYLLKCYNDFRKVPVQTKQTPFIDDSALQSLVGEMFAGRKQCTWTSLELHSTFVAYGGSLTRKQVFTYLGDDVVVLSIQGCASVVGFREFVGKILKLSTVDSIDEESEDILIRKITTEARGIPSNNKQYDLEDFTSSKTKKKPSATLLRFISKLVSYGKITKASMSLSEAI